MRVVIVSALLGSALIALSTHVADTKSVPGTQDITQQLLRLPVAERRLVIADVAQSVGADSPSPGDGNATTPASTAKYRLVVTGNCLRHVDFTAAVSVVPADSSHTSATGRCLILVRPSGKTGEIDYGDTVVIRGATLKADK